jgi:hypothetical protein
MPIPGGKKHFFLRIVFDEVKRKLQGCKFAGAYRLNGNIGIVRREADRSNLAVRFCLSENLIRSSRPHDLVQVLLVGNVVALDQVNSLGPEPIETHGQFLPRLASLPRPWLPGNLIPNGSRLNPFFFAVIVDVGRVKKRYPAEAVSDDDLGSSRPTRMMGNAAAANFSHLEPTPAKINGS